jgi:pyruvate dehydrogenase E2 component (dihydrolipoamide acetyltransferase)
MVPELPEVDFARFGAVAVQALSRINRLTGQNLHRNWVRIPHVTQFDEADITELEAFRRSLNEEYRDRSIKVTVLTFLMKAAVSALKAFPHFNASLDPGGEQLIIKHYYHMGVAVDTSRGLVVPVLRDVDRKSVVELAEELRELSARAREGRLSSADMQGGCFSISSLGGVGGTAFTPIINAPEVAILGVSRAAIRPVYMEGEFAPRLILPLSLSYDHRVIDGVAGARFTRFLAALLSDTRRMLL